MEHQMKPAIVVALAVILLPGSRALAEQERAISVTGYGEIETEPDIADVRLGIFVFDKDLLAAKREADKKISALVSTLVSMEIEAADIATTQLYVRPQYKDTDQGYEFVGYEVTRSMTVTLRKINRLNELLEQSIQKGANRIERIDLATSQEQQLKDRVLDLAIADAKNVAGKIAKGFGAKLGKVMTICLDSGGGGARFNVMSAPVFSQAEYQPGLITVSAEIEVIFALEN
jgi:uncharacterized protein YggE